MSTGLDFPEGIAAFAEEFEVPGEGAGITGHVDDAGRGGFEMVTAYEDKFTVEFKGVTADVNE